MKTETSNEAYPATLIVHTPTGPVPACTMHAEMIKSLMSFMGAYTNATPAPEGSECSNCKHQAKSSTQPK